MNYYDISWAAVGKWTSRFGDHYVTVYSWWVNSPHIRREFLVVHHWEPTDHA